MDKEKYNAYHKEYQLKRYHRRRNAAILQLGGKCISCSSYEELELDHINPKDKLFSIAKLWGLSEEKWQSEIAKCQLLCKTCHIDKTRKDNGHDSRHTHGTYACYRHGGCRCKLCKNANREAQKKFRNKYS